MILVSTTSTTTAEIIYRSCVRSCTTLTTSSSLFTTTTRKNRVINRTNYKIVNSRFSTLVNQEQQQQQQGSIRQQLSSSYVSGYNKNLIRNSHCGKRQLGSTTTSVSESDQSCGLLLVLGVGSTSPITKQKRGLSLLVPWDESIVVPVKCGPSDDHDVDETVALIQSIINQHYSDVSSDYIGGMGENDPGVWFAAVADPTTTTNLIDTLQYSTILQQSIELIKEERHGVPFGVYTTGRIPIDSLEIPFAEIGIDTLHVSLYASTPDQYIKVVKDIATIQEARKVFGQVCSTISDATEQGVNVHAGVLQSFATTARDLAYSLGAIHVNIFPDENN